MNKSSRYAINQKPSAKSHRTLVHTEYTSSHGEAEAIGSCRRSEGFMVTVKSTKLVQRVGPSRIHTGTVWTVRSYEKAGVR
jgi:hypothetical protein